MEIRSSNSFCSLCTILATHTFSPICILFMLYCHPSQVQFPIVIGHHWFLFSVCLKAKVFAFCDSLYDQNDAFHNAIREPLVSSLFQQLCSNSIAVFTFLLFKQYSFLLDHRFRTSLHYGILL
jgi:hypothetical protein